jgi:hypothetical protein
MPERDRNADDRGERSAVPGESTQTIVCSSASFLNLNTVLQNEDPGGSWTNPGGDPHTGVYDPLVDSSGTYTYTVTGPSCDPQSATVEVTEIEEADAGTSNATTLWRERPHDQPLPTARWNT